MKVTKTRNKLKIMGLLLTLVMMVSLLGLFSLTASAAEGDACVSTTDCTGAYAKGICSVCGGYQPATLSEDGVYEIGNAGQLLWFAELVNANSTDMLVNEAVEVDAKLTADIDMTGLSWIPIGQNAKEGDSVYSYGFGGTFDGCGHAVGGIDCAVTTTGTSSSSDSPAAGFFGKICGATIRNLIVEGDFSAVYAGTSTNPAARAGGIVAYAYGNTNNRNLIENCGFKGTIYVKGKLMTHAGGVVGYANQSDIKNCWSVATVESGGATYDYIGGFGGNSSSANTYENCYYDSNICALGAYYNGDLSGVTGKTSSDFENGSVCELVGYHSLDENCVCTICGAVEHNNFDIKGFCTVCEAYQPATDSNSDGYYEIDNAGKLFWFANHVNTMDRTATAVLVADIDLENRPWTPIGSTGEQNHNFRGVFDGQNHTIKGLYVEGGRAGLGFFGEVRTGTVKNFTIYGEVIVNTQHDYVGGVIGSICGLNSTDHGLERNGAIIQNITSYVNLTAKAHGVGMIGGFVGYANHQSLIENCSWYGTFDAGIYRVDSGAGGFIGKIQENTSEVTIRNCAAYGTIKTNYEKNSFNNTPTIYMGGFLSFSNTGAGTVLENCLFAGKFERGENLTDQAFLGAFGTLRSVNSIKNCYYLGDGVLEAVHSDSNLKPGSDNVEITSVTKAQLLSGEVAYKLGEHFGQILEGENRQSYPVLGGRKVEDSQRFEIYGNSSTSVQISP